MNRLGQIVWILFATIFIVLTLGFISVELEWDDGSRFRYRGWRRKVREYTPKEDHKRNYCKYVNYSHINERASCFKDHCA